MRRSMKLVINFDFFNTICNINEPFNGFRIIKDRSIRFSKTTMPFLFLLDCAFLDCNFISVFNWLFLQYLIDLGYGIVDCMDCDEEDYKKSDIKKIMSLVKSFRDINISTDYELLLQSQLYSKNYNINTKVKGLFDILEEKYFEVFVYDYKGDIDTVSIKQEHVVGSKEYVLSLGKPKGQNSLAFSQC